MPRERKSCGTLDILERRVWKCNPGATRVSWCIRHLALKHVLYAPSILPLLPLLLPLLPPTQPHSSPVPVVSLKFSASVSFSSNVYYHSYYFLDSNGCSYSLRIYRWPHFLENSKDTHLDFVAWFVYPYLKLHWH